MDEMLRFIEASIKEEAEDKAKYLAWADKAEQAGYHHTAGMLRDIAHEEHTHHEALEHILRHMKK
jgi:rubrerythrin